MEIISELLVKFAVIFSAIAPAVFIFSVTLLGAAISKAEQEEKDTRMNDKENLTNEISEIERSLDEAKNSGDTTLLNSKVENLKKQQKETENKISEIKQKYNAINLSNTVIYPLGAFILSISLGIILNELQFNVTEYLVIFLLQFGVLIYGVHKLYKSLELVEEISTHKDENKHYKLIKEAHVQALEEFQKSREEEVEFTFVSKKFPLNASTDMEIKIPFRVKLSKGSMLKNASVWFYIADGLELIKPLEANSWRQSSDYDPPNIRTVRVGLGDLSVGPNTPRELVIKTPNYTGKFLIRYSVNADGYSGDINDIYIEV